VVNLSQIDPAPPKNKGNLEFFLGSLVELNQPLKA